MSESTIYWITRLDGVNNLLAWLIGILVILLVLSFICQLQVCDDDDSERKRLEPQVTRFITVLFWCVVATVLAAVFTPTTKEMVAIKVIPALANSRLADKSLQNIDALLDVCVEQLKARKKD